MRNKDKLIAEIMAVCCVLSTSTFFNMHGMAAAGKEQTFTFTYTNTDGISEYLGENIEAVFNCEVQPITNNIGCIKYVIDFNQDYSPDRLDEVVTKLAIKKESENGDFIKMSDLVTDGVANAPVKIYNLEHFFNEKDDSLIKFGISAEPAEPNTTGQTEVGLDFIETESTDPKSQTQREKKFSVCRMKDKEPTIQYDPKTYKMTLIIYVDLPELEGYSSFKVTATIKDESTLGFAN